MNLSCAWVFTLLNKQIKSNKNITEVLRDVTGEVYSKYKQNLWTSPASETKNSAIAFHKTGTLFV